MMADRTDRRAHRRLRAGDCNLQSARVRPGHDLGIVNISATGILVESSYRLLPGMRVDVRLGRNQHPIEVVRGCVLRCAVADLHPDRISYRGAIAFERALNWLGHR